MKSKCSSWISLIVFSIRSNEMIEPNKTKPEKEAGTDTCFHLCSSVVIIFVMTVTILRFFFGCWYIMLHAPKATLHITLIIYLCDGLWGFLFFVLSLLILFFFHWSIWRWCRNTVSQPILVYLSFSENECIHSDLYLLFSSLFISILISVDVVCCSVYSRSVNP